MDPIVCIVLAAGLGKRMGLTTPKVVVEAGGRPLIQYVVETASKIKPTKIVIVTGHGGDLVKEAVFNGATAGLYGKENIEFAVQKEQKGTGDAVRSALDSINGFRGTVVLLNGDMPLVTAHTLEGLLGTHRKNNATLSLVSTRSERYSDFGRIIRDATGRQVKKITEAKDCTPEESFLTEVNASLYAVDSAFLVPTIKGLKNDNAQKEYYLTDIVEKSVTEGQTTVVFASPNTSEFQGVNTRYDLAQVNEILRERAVRELILSGVLVEDLRSLYVDSSVHVAPGVRIGPGVQLRGKTQIAEGVVIEGNTFIKDSIIGPKATIKFSVKMEGAIVGSEAAVGPFAHLRAGSDIGAEAKIGNFVETKNAKFESGSKASHLSYIGDATVGADANIGAGTITCNYDGYRKARTEIGRGAFIGSNSSLVAPVTIEDGATVGAGSVITKTVKKDSLAVTRASQISKAGWSKDRRERMKGEGKKTK